MTLLKFLTTGVIVLVLTVFAFAVWIYRFSGPSLTTWDEDGSVVLANVHLGEYFLGFTELEVTELDTGRKLLHAFRGDGEIIDRVRFDPSADILEAVVSAGWTVTAQAPDRTLSPGSPYRVIVRGNNGFGYSNQATTVITVPQQGASRMPNNALNLTVTSLACARAAPAG